MENIIPSPDRGPSWTFSLGAAAAFLGGMATIVVRVDVDGIECVGGERRTGKKKKKLYVKKIKKPDNINFRTDRVP